ncbi:MAG TPA: adenosylmethionine--8-amino-7-oxononanoate transaminase, partial [Sorangium sp.]|nr:adenosylmethionine--8-amino-7-oxononanoate transaminase [Sorangium sp.]
MKALLSQDARRCWHPFTQAATAPPPLPVVGAQGAWLTLADGRRIFDGLSSWWSTLHGHGHPTIVRAIAEQAARLDHVLFAGCTHPPAVALAERLIAAAPGGFSRVFFSDNGSTAVEVALKMAFQYHINRGTSRRRHFICLEGGYHGDTIGAMSAGDPGTFGEPFEPLLFPVTRIAPALTHGRDDTQAALQHALAALDRAFAQHAGQVAALVVEPMLQGAAGMRMMPPAYLRALRQRCSEHGALLIADEVMTGFARTGHMFAQQHADIAADIMCLSKGISGGVLPLAATLAPEHIYQAFLHQDMRRGFLHGHTYTANPIACAAAVASLQLFEQEQTLTRVANIEAFYARRLPLFGRHRRVANVRWMGSIGVVELAGGPAGYYNPLGSRIHTAMLKRGFLVRPLGAVVYT